MPESLNRPTEPERWSTRFPSTHWGQVQAAGDENSPEHDSSLQALYERYWRPVYACLRGRGVPPDEAKDLTQEFFVFLIEHHTIGKADPARGRFRSFLLAVLGNFLSVRLRHDAAITRGAMKPFLTWDEVTAQQLCQQALLHSDTPERAFERRWAIDLLERVMTRLRTDQHALANSALLERLQSHLCNDDDATPYKDLAQELHMSAVALRVTVHRLRHRYRELLRQEIMATGVPLPEVNDEIRHLATVLCR